MATEHAIPEVSTLRSALLERLGKRAADYPEYIEKHFPRILHQLVELWGSETLEPYLQQLVFTDRSNRHGFPQEVVVELFHVQAALLALGLSRQQPGLGWSSIAWDIREPDLRAQNPGADSAARR